MFNTFWMNKNFYIVIINIKKPFGFHDFKTFIK